MALIIRITKQDAEKWLANVPGEHVFWLRDGRNLKNVRELGEALAVMNTETYSHHANTQKNDFSRWVKDIIGDGKLSRDLAKSRSREQAAKAVKQRVNFLSAKLS